MYSIRLTQTCQSTHILFKCTPEFKISVSMMKVLRGLGCLKMDAEVKHFLRIMKSSLTSFDKHQCQMDDEGEVVWP